MDKGLQHYCARIGRAAKYLLELVVRPTKFLFCRSKRRSLVILTALAATVVLMIFHPTWTELLRIKRRIESTTSIPDTATSIPICDCPSVPHRRYLYHKSPFPIDRTGLGNRMFMHASQFGISYHCNRTAIDSTDGHLRNIFEITMKWTPSESQFEKSIFAAEHRAGFYDLNILRICSNTNNNNRSVLVSGYLQSWRYFVAVEKQIRREFTFKKSLKSGADEFLRKSSVDLDKSRAVRFIGVHIRRKDMLDSYNIKRGFTVANKVYIVNATDYTRNSFPDDNLIYVVCSDDVDWAEKNFPPLNSRFNRVVFCPRNRTAAEDLALLVACNHTIMTVGTYGWWAGFLAGGKTIYYKNFPVPGTTLKNLYHAEDYYRPQWIGL